MVLLVRVTKTGTRKDAINKSLREREVLDYSDKTLGAAWRFVAEKFATGTGFRVHDIPASHEFSQLSLAAVLLRLKQVTVSSKKCKEPVKINEDDI